MELRRFARRSEGGDRMGEKEPGMEGVITSEIVSPKVEP